MFESTRQGAVDLISGDDPLSTDRLAGLAKLLQDCLQTGQPRAVLDMARTPLVDSAGLDLLLDFHDAFLSRGGAFKLAAANPLCREILLATGVDRHFEMFADAVSAVGSFAQ